MTIENHITIAAPIAKVWAVTEDIERWPNWTPTIEKVTRLDDGFFGAGSSARIKQPGLPEAIWGVTAVDAGQSFTWETRVRGMRMIATHELTPTDMGTQCTLRLTLKGLVAFLLWPMIRSKLVQALQQENDGLKVVCESTVQSHDTDRARVPG